MRLPPRRTMVAVSAALALAGAVASVHVITRGTSPNSVHSSQQRVLAAHEQPLAGVFLPVPAAAYIRLLPNCLWPNKLHTITLTRHTGQYLNLVNVATLPHRFYQDPTLYPMPAWKVKSHDAIATLWKNPGVKRVTTCAGNTILTVNVTG